jgi:hypothetical protein
LWSADVVEQALSLDDIQRAKFNGLKAASQGAIEYLNESCPKTNGSWNFNMLAVIFDASSRLTAARAFSS